MRIVNSLQDHYRISEPVNLCDSLRHLIDSGNGVMAEEWALSVMETKNPDREICALYSLGYYFLVTGQYDSSLFYLERAVSLKPDPGCADYMQSVIRQSMHLMGMAFQLKGERESARMAYKMVLHNFLENEPDDHTGIAIIYLNIGSLYQYDEDYLHARQYFQEALRYSGDQQANEVLLSYIYNNLGTVCLSLGQPRDALHYLAESEKLLLQLFPVNHPEHGEYHYNSGLAYLDLGDFGKALHHNRMAAGIYDGMMPWLADCQCSAGKIYSAMNMTDSARLYFNSCLEMLKEHFGEQHPSIAMCLNDIAGILYRNHEFDTAHALFREAIKSNISGKASMDDCFLPESCDSILSKPELVVSLAGMILSGSQTEKYRDNLLCNQKAGQSLVNILEKVIAGHKDQGSKFLYAEKTRRIMAQILRQKILIPEYGDLSPQQAALFFLLLEKCKANILANSMTRLPNQGFSGERRDLVNEQSRLQSIQHSLELSDKFSGRIKDSIENRRFRLILALDSITETSETSKVTGFFSDTTALPSLQQVMDCLAPDEAILNYMLLDSGIMVSTITREGMQLHKLASGTSDLLIKKYLKSLRMIDIPGARTMADSLFRILLKPILRNLTGISKLIIIPDGLLFYLPFESLVTRTENGKPRYLIQDFEIVYNYSVAVWYHSVKNCMWPGLRQIHSFAGFAPVFRSAGSNNMQYLDSTSLRSFTDKDGYIIELPYTEEEINIAMETLSGMGIEAISFLHGEATELNFKNNFRDHDIVHIASHGFSNEDYGISGLVFSRQEATELSQNNKPEDGLFFMDELPGQEGHNKLVILSCCESGLGRLAGGEGVISLTRGFLDAGSGQVIVSLWKVSDFHTKEFMEDFYRHLVLDNTPAKALRQAKISMLENQRTSFPGLWATFVIIGH